MDKVCVAILNWNGSALLRRFLPSVLEHSTWHGMPVQVVVADNGSTDDSLRVLGEEFPRVRVLPFERNWGFSGGYNRTLEALDAEYVLLFNSDVRVSCGYLDALVDALEENPCLAACQPKILSLNHPQRFEYAGASGGYLDALGYPYCRGRVFGSLEEDRGQYDHVADIHWASGAALMVRRSCYLSAGGLDEEFFAHMEEIDLCCRMRRMGWRVMALPQSRVYHLGGATLGKADSRKTFLNFRNNLLLLVKNLPLGRLLAVLSLRLVLDYVAAGQMLLKGQGKHAAAVVKARWSFLSMARRMRKKYRDSLLKKDTTNVLGRKLILLSYHLLGRKTFDKIGA